MKRIAELPPEERPREKLDKLGPGALSDVELLTVLLGTGSKHHPVMRVADKVLACLDATKNAPAAHQLRAIPGVGPVRASFLGALMEFARRRIRPAGLTVRHPEDLLPLIGHYADRKQEYLLCTSLNGAAEVIATRVVTMGLLDRAQIHPREVFADPIAERAAAVILAHNHPSGNVQPSREDIRATRRLTAAGKLLGIPVRDHIIFSHHAWFSFAKEQMLHPETEEALMPSA